MIVLFVNTYILQLIPGAGFHQRHLGFEWGPGDLLVYETNYKLQGINIQNKCWRDSLSVCERT